MQQVISDEHIDKSVWLPKVFDEASGSMRDMEAVTKERKTKSDLHEYKDEELHTEGYKSFAWAPDEMHRRSLIEQRHHWVAEVIMRLHDAALRVLDPKASKAIIEMITGMPSEGTLSAHDIYFGLIRGVHGKARFEDGKVSTSLLVEPLSRRRWHLIDRVCFQPVRMNDYGWIAHCKFSIHDAFEAAEEKLGELFAHRKSVNSDA